MYHLKTIARAFREQCKVPAEPAQGRGANMTWKHPPLVLTKPLDCADRDVQKLIDVQAGKGLHLDDMVNLFEETVDTFFVSKLREEKDAAQFVMREARIPSAYRSWLFPTKQAHHALAVLLWVAGNMGGEFSYGPDHVTLHVGSAEIGMRSGHFLSLYEVNRVPCPDEDWKRFFEWPRGSSWCSVRAFNNLQVANQYDEGAVMVLRLIRATNNTVDQFVYYVYGHQAETPLPHQRTLYKDFLRRLESSLDPYTSISRFLVPAYMSEHAFRASYGGPHRWVDDEFNDGTANLLDKFYRDTKFLTTRG